MTNTLDRFHQLALAHRSIIDKVLYKDFYGFSTYFTPDNLSDLYDEGYIALYRAATRYQEDKGASFATFAYKCVKNGLFDYIRKNILLMYDKKDQEADPDLDIDLDLDMEWQIESASTSDNIFFMDIDDLYDSIQYNYDADYLYDSIDRNIAIDTLSSLEKDIFTNKTGIGVNGSVLSTKQLADKYGYTTQHINRLYRAAEQKVLAVIQSA